MMGMTDIRKTAENELVYRSVAEALRKANLRLMDYYWKMRWINFKAYATTLDI